MPYLPIVGIGELKAGRPGEYDLSMLDINKLLAELRGQRDLIDVAIQALTRVNSDRGAARKCPDFADLARALGVKGKSGRKSMSATERQEVSRRMSHYWAQRRAGAS